MFLKKYVIFPLFVTFFIAYFIACENTPPNAVAADLTGFEQNNYTGNVKKVVKKDANGLVLEDGYVQSGKKVGSWVVYYPSGMPKKLTTFIDGLATGSTYEYNDKGQLEVRANYREGLLDGKMLRFRYAQVMEETPFVKGKIEGTYRKFYVNSKIETVAEYKNGVQDGRYQFFTEDGTMTMDYTYQNGQKISGGPVNIPNSTRRAQ